MESQKKRWNFGLRLESKPYRATNLLPAGPDNAGMPQASISDTVFEGIAEENMSEGECRNTGVPRSSASVMALAFVHGIGL